MIQLEKRVKVSDRVGTLERLPVEEFRIFVSREADSRQVGNKSTGSSFLLYSIIFQLTSWFCYLNLWT
jgi:hypothetical protein